MNRIVVVGGSLAGLRAIETLRAEGFTGSLALVGAEPHPPYDRPPLSKAVLTGRAEPDAIVLRAEDAFAELDVELHLGRSAIGLDPTDKTLALDDGASLTYDAVLIATGSTPRQLRNADGLAGVHTLRTLDDALEIRGAMASGARVVVVGAGFIGTEVASSARARGLEVTVIEPEPVPLARALGTELGAEVGRLCTAHGVSLRLGVGVAAVEGVGRVEQVRLSDGSQLAADLVVVGIGVRPATDWLAGSGLPIDDGIRCEPTCAVSGVDGVFAAGDVVRWTHPLFGTSLRLEHWTNAVEQGSAVARNILRGPGAAEPFASVPYFWSDQFGMKIQFVGVGSGADTIHVVEDTSGQGRVVAYYGRDDRLVGCLGFSQPKIVMQARRAIANRVAFAEAVALARA